MLERMTRNARGANNYLETRLEYAPDGSSRMHVSIVPPLQEAMKKLPPYHAHYFRGILHAALEASNAKGIEVTIEEHDVENKRTVYAIRYAL
jgi:uncharacterized protein (TIGR02265 family)